MKAIGIIFEEKNILNKFPKLNGKTEIGKNDFIDVLTTEYHEKLEINKK